MNNPSIMNNQLIGGVMLGNIVSIMFMLVFEIFLATLIIYNGWKTYQRNAGEPNLTLAFYGALLLAILAAMINTYQMA